MLNPSATSVPPAQKIEDSSTRLGAASIEGVALRFRAASYVCSFHAAPFTTKRSLGLAALAHRSRIGGDSSFEEDVRS
jgi:hypothetical protein